VQCRKHSVDLFVFFWPEHGEVAVPENFVSAR
jgi:hypothetical protein